MRLPSFEYLEPRSIEEASRLLKEQGDEAKVIAGGTDLLPSMKHRIFRPKSLIALDRIPDLDRVAFDKKGGLRLGPMVRLHALGNHPVILERFPMLRQAANAVGSPQLRQMGTLGGNLGLDTRCYYYNQSSFWRSCRSVCIKMGGETCNAVGGGKKCFAVFSGDLAPALIALGAKIRLFSKEGERVLSLDDFYSGNGAEPLAKKPDEMVTGVEVPPPPKGALSAYYKYRIRKSIDFPLAGVAACLAVDKREKVCKEARVVISAVGQRPQAIGKIGELLRGRKLEAPIMEEASNLAFKTAKPVANTGSSPAYRRFMIKVFVRRALEKAAEGNGA